MRRPLLALTVGIAGLALSIPLALLGRSVLAAPDRLAAATTGPAPGARAGRGSFFERAADDLLGVDTSQPFFTLAREYKHAASTPIVTLNAAAPVRLARLASEVGPATERSQAHLMVGAVFALPAGNGSITFARMRQLGGGRLLTQATGEIQRASELDEHNEAAKYDLELLLMSEAAASAAQAHKPETTRTDRPKSRRRKAGHDARHPPTKRRLRQGGVYGSGSGY